MTPTRTPTPTPTAVKQYVDPHPTGGVDIIRKYMDMNCTKQLHGLVMSKLDYANAILYGLPDNVVKQLQHVQNAAAKVIFQKRKYDHVTPILKELHWLPVQFG